MRIAVVVLACAAITGCISGMDPALELDETSLDRAAAYQSMAKLNTQPYTSDIGAFTVNCYVAGDVDRYRKIHPEQTGTNVTVARGTLIVREVLDASGRVSKLTMMAKGPPGYDPSLGDWWFAVTDPQGVPLVENGAIQLGRLKQCHNCHLDRPRDDFLFGVPGNT